MQCGSGGYVVHRTHLSLAEWGLHKHHDSAARLHPTTSLSRQTSFGKMRFSNVLKPSVDAVFCRQAPSSLRTYRRRTAFTRLSAPTKLLIYRLHTHRSMSPPTPSQTRVHTHPQPYGSFKIGQIKAKAASDPSRVPGSRRFLRKDHQPLFSPWRALRAWERPASDY